MKTLFFIFIFILLSSFLHATIINVPTPYTTIQAGINAAANGDTVLVQPGTYMEVYLRFYGKLVTVGSLFLTTQDTTYISSTIIDGDNHFNVVTFDDQEDSTAVLCGFTIRNGDGDRGGGILCEYSSSPSLENLIITGNHAYSEGGGICCFDGCNPILQNVTISGNYADLGGGIYCGGSSPILENVTISGNYADLGGGIFCEQDSNPILQNVTISGNYASVQGGGFFCNDSGNPILINSILWNNFPEEINFYYAGYPNSITISYSDIQGGEPGIVTNNNGTVSWLGGNRNEDPLFVDPGNSKYHLFYNSPCIDTGDPASPLDPDGTRVDMGAYYFDQSINGNPTIIAITDVPNDQGRSVIVTWQKSLWDIEFSSLPITGYNLWEKYPFELDRSYNITNDINQAILEQDTYFYREDTTWVLIANVFAMQWEEYSVHAVTYIDSTTVGDYLSYFFVSAHTINPSLYFSSSVESGYSVDNIAPDETRVYIAQNGSNIGLNWDEVEYGTFQGNSYPEINGIWYKIYAGDSPDYACDEAHLIDTVTDLNYDYILTGEEKKFFKIVVSDQPEAGRISNRSKNLEEPSDGFHKIGR